ncbi:putative secondary metabolism biosynthetic enzyme [Venturia effusa]|uniref:Putative secondary metabolism biosynthetic enzyme n=1 Tax=Venturia effusa TaxID=50376 RepID=A0A517LJH3_9PEZI|nr:putative secondary metabolism biosynthetic enzyme [Venturia effusa]
MAQLNCNYFICTLGEAAELQGPSGTSYTTVTHLVEQQAHANPDLPAFAFPRPETSTPWGVQLYAFKDLRDGSARLASEFRSQLGNQSHHTVALLCPSSIEFVFAWLALMRAGFSVLIIAPQCQPVAIAHLCASCNANFLIHDEAYSGLAHSASSVASFGLTCTPLPRDRRYLDFIGDPNACDLHTSTTDTIRVHTSRDIAFFFHTSGTSTGLPKPIPQTHHAAVKVLPSMDGRLSATFTTTPLYHGGIADCLRAWTSCALIWLFPGTDVPITSKNILLSLQCAEAAVERGNAPPIRYFASVPYILQMLAEEDKVVNILKCMDIVSVGGAALSQRIGDKLVGNGVNLVSRFGSAECGFLLSSHRLYENDKEWQFLRLPAKNHHLSFELEDNDSGLFQLIVLPSWPHVAKTNRPDGSFATSDLFEPHPRLSNAWKYHSRSDSQITLSTGKKFDPAPVEDWISSALPLIKDVLVFGNGQQVPGLLVFPSNTASENTDTNLEKAIWKIVQETNSQGQEHTQIPRNMISIRAFDDLPLPKSSKGTVLRNIAYEKYAKQIETMYNGGAEDGGYDLRLISNVPSEKDVLATVRKIVEAVTNSKGHLTDEADFYQHGIDSAMSSQIRGRLTKITRAGLKLPWSVVYDCGNIAALSKHVFDILHGKSPEVTEDASQVMLDLAVQYSKFSSQPLGDSAKGARPSVIVLTGATGSLGAHILHQLTRDLSLSKVVCLVRAQNDVEAKSRVLNSLHQKRLSISQNQDSDTSVKLVCYAASLATECLGLPLSVFTELEKEVTHVIHSAWAVNFSLPLQSFTDNIAGLHALIALTITSKQNAKMTFCSSTASVLCSTADPIPETISSDPEDADSLGYSRSKWVAERICSSASLIPSMAGRISVLRIGQLTGDTKTGVWNTSEAWPLMLSTVEPLGCLPRLKGEKLNWLPVDTAAKAVCEIILDTGTNQVGRDGESEECHVYHLVANVTPKTPTWLDLLTWIQGARRGAFDVVAPQVWLDRLRLLESHPAQALLVLWERAYGLRTAGGQNDEKGVENARSRPGRVFDTARAEWACEGMRTLEVVDETLVGKIWGWLHEEMAARA